MPQLETASFEFMTDAKVAAREATRHLLLAHVKQCAALLWRESALPLTG